MMETIRTAANNIVIKIIFGIIIVAFIFTGVGSFLGFGGSSASDEQMYIAKVDGEGISRAAFEHQVNNEQKNYQLLGGGQDESVNKYMRREALFGLINDHLNYQLSLSLGNRISDNAVKELIRKQEVFFEGGKFNNQRFLSLLASNNYTPDSYALLLRADMQKTQMLSALMLSDFPLPLDADISALQNQKRIAYLADFTTEMLDKSNIEILDNEIEEFYESNKQSMFNYPDRVKFKYLGIYYPTVAKSITVKSEEVKAIYDKNKSSYKAPKKYKYNVMIFDDQDSAQNEYNSLLKGTNDSSIEVIQLGWFSENNLPELLKKVYIKKGNKFSEPFSDGEKYFIAILDGEKNDGFLPYSYVKDQIMEELKTQRTQDAYNEIYSKIKIALAKGYKSIEDIAKDVGLELYQSDWITESNNFEITRFPEVKSAVFSELMIKDGQVTSNISDIIHAESVKSDYVVQVTGFSPKGIAPLNDELRKYIKELLLTEKSKVAFKQEVNEIVNNLKEGINDERLNFVERAAFDRSETTEENRKMNEAVFSITPAVENSAYGSYLMSEKTAKIVALVSVNNGEKNDISEVVSQNLLNNTSYYFSEYLRSKANIEIMPNANL